MIVLKQVLITIMVQDPKKMRSGNPGPLFLDFSNLFDIVQKLLNVK